MAAEMPPFFLFDFLLKLGYNIYRKGKEYRIMREVLASYARHLSDEFWRANQCREYKEKIMSAIENRASGGNRNLVWRYSLSHELKNWLMLLGYTLVIETENRDLKLYKYIISW